MDIKILCCLLLYCFAALSLSAELYLVAKEPDVFHELVETKKDLNTKGNIVNEPLFAKSFDILTLYGYNTSELFLLWLKH